MKADLTRLTFEPTKHYRGVHQQQGRVQLDSDWNEQLDITSHRVETETVDVVGTCAAPLHNDGFRLVAAVGDLTPDEATRPGNKTPPAVATGDLLITAGRFYAGGVLCENERICLASAQPDLPTAAEITAAAGTQLLPLKLPGTYLAYLDSWARHRTAIDDPQIREVALGGPDTATRTKNAWQVKFLTAPDGANCSTALPAWDALVNPTLGTLAAKVATPAGKTGPCIVDPGSGYRRLENQLYRVEVHQGGDALNKTIFKWSRDNGSVVTRWVAKQVGSDDLEVETTGRDKVLNLAAGHWVELTDDVHEELGIAGSFAKITNVQGNIITVDSANAIGPIERAGFPRNPKVRRWDSTPAKAGKWIAPDGEKTLNTTDFFELEDGVVVKFGAGVYRTGDYWIIPARTALPYVEWPTVANLPVAQVPHGVVHHFCKLAVVKVASAGVTVTDCRPLFPPLTELTALYYVSGDSQEATPDPTKPATSPLPLPLPLKVGVSNGEWPVKGARVRFTVKIGGGTVNPASGIVTTGADGIASCDWTINASVLQHEVRAELLDSANNPVHLPVIFHARLNTAKQVSYDPAKCAHMSGVTPPIITVQDAIDFLCQESHSEAGCCVTVGKIGEQPGDYPTLEAAFEDLLKKKKLLSICIELLPGTHVIDKPLQVTSEDIENGIVIKIDGCSHRSVLLLRQTLTFTALQSLTVRDLTLVMQGGRLVTSLCWDVEVEDCVIKGFSSESALVTINARNRIQLGKNDWHAFSQNLSTPPRILAKSPALVALMAMSETAFAAESRKLVEQLAATALTARTELAESIGDALQKATEVISAAERKSYINVIAALKADQVSAAVMTRELSALHDFAAAAGTSSATALVILPPAAETWLTDNLFTGFVSLAGNPTQAGLTDNEVKQLSVMMSTGAITLEDNNQALHLRNNRFDRIVGGEADLGLLKAAVKAGNGKVSVWQASLMTDNLFTGVNNFYAARHAAFTNNRFLGKTDAGTAVAFSATCFGNSAENDFRLFVISQGLVPNPPNPFNSKINIVNS